MVYVDPIASCLASRRWRWDHSCHLYADTAEELHRFAPRLGLRHSWFQAKDDLPHYDLTRGLRALAIRLGAVETDREHVVEYMRRRRAMLTEA